MSFGSPPPNVVMPTPPPPIQPLSPAQQKPGRQSMEPTFISDALTPTPQQRTQPTLIGGAPTSLGTAA